MRTCGSRLAAALVWVLLAASARVAVAQSANADDLYAEALSREASLRRDLGATEPAKAAQVIRRIRTLVGAFQDLSKLFPTSLFADDALWHGASLAADVFDAYADPADRDTALRLFTRLTSAFPSSPLARQVPQRIAGLSTPSRVAVPPTAAPATPASTHASPPRPGVQPRAAPLSAPATALPTASPATPAVSPGAAPALLTAIRREERPDVLRVVLELDREVTFEAERLEGPPRLFLDLPRTRAVEALPNTPPASDGLIRQIRIGRQADRTRVVLDLQNGVGPHSVYALYDPYRVVVDFERPHAGKVAARTPVSTRTPTVRTEPLSPVPPGRVARPAWLPSRRVALSTRAQTPTVASGHATRTAAAPAGAVAGTVPSAPPAANASGRFSLARQLGLGVSRVVIDPGHGGIDPGAKVQGLTEAELTLDVALRLEQLLLTRSGIDAVLTRRTDAFVSLEERTAVANGADADVFVSLHINASRSAGTNGVESYFLNVASTAAAEAVAARENATSSRHMRHLPELLRTLTLRNKLAESRDLATSLQTSLYGHLRRSSRDVRNLGVKQAPFMVLLGATMPSALIELSFITNRDEAARLRTQSYRQLLADGLHAGLLQYQQSVKRAAAIAQR